MIERDIIRRLREHSGKLYPNTKTRILEEQAADAMEALIEERDRYKDMWLDSKSTEGTITGITMPTHGYQFCPYCGNRLCTNGCVKNPPPDTTWAWGGGYTDSTLSNTDGTIWIGHETN